VFQTVLIVHTFSLRAKHSRDYPIHACLARSWMFGTAGLTWEEVPGAVPQEVEIPVVCKIAHPRLASNVDVINFGNVILRNEVTISIVMTNVGDGPVFQWTAVLPAQFVTVEPNCGVCTVKWTYYAYACLCVFLCRCACVCFVGANRESACVCWLVMAVFTKWTNCIHVTSLVGLSERVVVCRHWSPMSRSL
jgi:hypothetical protein